MVEELLDAIEGRGRPLASLAEARRAAEIGFATHESHRRGGARVAPAEIDRDRRVVSFPWGNE